MAIPYEHDVDPRATNMTTARLKAFGMSFPMFAIAYRLVGSSISKRVLVHILKSPGAMLLHVRIIWGIDSEVPEVKC